MNIAILIVVSVVNFAFGVIAAAFFGFGPRRLRRVVKWVNNPPIRTPSFLRGLADTLRRSWAAFGKSAPDPAD
jgi:hypothetical protein